MRKYSILCFLISTVSYYACTQSKTGKLDDLVSTYAAYGKFNGSILVAQEGQIIYKKGFGLANVEWGIPNQPDTRHRLASISKQFTAMLIAQLAAENKLKLDVPISTYLPDYPKKAGNIITLHHLLTHSSGIPNYTSFQGYRDMMRDPHSPGEIVKLFADEPLEFTPGEKFEYSNSGYVLLGYIIEKVTGKSYAQVLQSKIFEPLKMNNTGYNPGNAVVKNMASGYEKVGNAFMLSAYIDMSVPFSAGGIYSTVEDMYLWDQALYTEKLLPQNYLDKVFRKHILERGDAYYGYGWDIGELAVGNTNDHVQTISHAGGINGFNTLITRIPGDKSLIVLLNNTGGAPLENMTRGIAGILYDKPYSFPKKSITNSIRDIIDKEGAMGAQKKYDEIRNSDQYEMNEFEMNSLGYQLLNEGKEQEAAAVFKMNMEAFPNSFNTYDSYGEALVALGDTTEGIEYYRKSLKLNPGSESGLKALRSLGINTDSLVKKISVEDLKIWEGEYLITNPPAGGDHNWKIEFKEVDGVLMGNDRGYRYKLFYMGDYKFVNPDDGASLEFKKGSDNEIILTLFGRFSFKKMI